jgi:L-Ala-D/L-Glu epimerase / N-acetyl-D-glutamate racemase
VRRSLLRLSLPFKQPFATASSVVGARDILLLRVEEDGVEGFGEAAPLEPFDGVSLEHVAAALLGGGAHAGPPHARAAEEMALLDLEARREGRPVGEAGADVIAVNCTLSAGPPEEVARIAAEGARAGYSCFKLKVGLPDDEDRVAAVREAIGPWPALRVDANGTWSAAQAVDTLSRVARHDLQLVEQPCRTLAEMAEVRRSLAIPVAADESVVTAADVRAAAGSEACDVVNVKLAGSGGWSGARAALRAAADHGLERFLSSTLDGPWGIAASLQLAAAEGVSLACGLATLELFDAPLARVMPPPHRGVLAVPRGPGLGVSPPWEAIEEVLVDRLL